jgi:hypothetical protein
MLIYCCILLAISVWVMLWCTDTRTSSSSTKITTFACSIPCIAVRLPQRQPTNARYSITFTIISHYKNHQNLHISGLNGPSTESTIIYWSVACKTTGAGTAVTHTRIVSTCHSTYSVQFCPLYIFCTEKFSTVLLHAKDQYIYKSFCTIIVLPDDGPISCRSLWFCNTGLLYIK